MKSPKYPDVITTEFIEEVISYIKSEEGDDEIQHSEEDALHQFVLQQIADKKCNEPAKCAALALKTLEMDFARWCA